MHDVDTTDWTVDDHIAWIRQYADSARIAARMVVGWHLDVLGIAGGTVEVVPWPEHEAEDIWMQRAGWQPKTNKPEGSRVIHAGGFAYLVRDVK